MHGQTAATLRRAPISRLGLTCSLSAPALLSLAVGHLSAASSCTAFSVPISLRPVTACQLRGSAFVTRNRRTETRHIEQAPKTNLLRMQTQETVSPPARVKVVVISGPTAVGKSALAESIAKGIPGGAELISADSVQVYRGMDIGSAKPTPEERSAVKYHLIDVVDPPGGSPSNVCACMLYCRYDLSCHGRGLHLSCTLISILCISASALSDDNFTSTQMSTTPQTSLRTRVRPPSRLPHEARCLSSLVGRGSTCNGSSSEILVRLRLQLRPRRAQKA